MKFGLRETVFIILLMGIPVATWWFVFRPRNAREAELINRIEAKQKKLQALNRTTGTIGDLQKEIQSLEEAVAYFQTKLPSEKEIDKVLKEVWLLADSNNLTTKSIRTRERRNSKATGQAKQRTEHAEQPIFMELEGDYMGFYSFLQAVENQPRIMRVQKINLSKLKKGAVGQVQVELEMSIFFERNSEDDSWPSQKPT